jgi:hypothetical protein
MLVDSLRNSGDYMTAFTVISLMAHVERGYIDEKREFQRGRDLVNAGDGHVVYLEVIDKGIRMKLHSLSDIFLRDAETREGVTHKVEPFSATHTRFFINGIFPVFVNHLHRHAISDGIANVQRMG